MSRYDYVVTLDCKEWLSHAYFEMDAPQLVSLVRDWVDNAPGRRYSMVKVNDIRLHKNSAMAVLLTMGITG